MELIDREALKDAVKRYAGEPIKKKDRKCQAICLDMLGTIDAQPIIYAVKVVRCKDCKHWDKVVFIDGVNYGTCERKCTAIRQDAFPNENWFCADGERRENDAVD